MVYLFQRPCFDMGRIRRRLQFWRVAISRQEKRRVASQNCDTLPTCTPPDTRCQWAPTGSPADAGGTLQRRQAMIENNPTNAQAAFEMLLEEIEVTSGAQRCLEATWRFSPEDDSSPRTWYRDAQWTHHSATRELAICSQGRGVQVVCLWMSV
jgi:hypothetical protein